MERHKYVYFTLRTWIYEEKNVDERQLHEYQWWSAKTELPLYLCTHTDNLRRSISGYGDAGGAASHSASIYDRRLTEREKRNGTRRLSPVDEATRVHLHESLLPDYNRVPGIALAIRRTRSLLTERAYVEEIGSGASTVWDRLTDRHAPRRRLTITMAKYAHA